MQSDALAELLHRPDLGPGVIATGMALALGFGALHALSPGHGKTLVGAYLVGSRGTFKHAALLGASVTVTHTFSVFLIGIATLFVSSYVVPEKIIPVLGVISGLSIVVIGAILFRKRLAASPWSRRRRSCAARTCPGRVPALGSGSPSLCRAPIRGRPSSGRAC